MVKSEAPPRTRMALTIVLVYVAWFYANLGPNGLFYMAALGRPAARVPGELLYYLGVSLAGIVVPLTLCRRWGIDLPFWPRRTGALFWLGSIGLLAAALILGLFAFEEGGMTWAQVGGQSVVWIVAPLFLLLPTMTAYTILWYGLMLPAIRRLLGGSKIALAAAVLITAAAFGLYHLASVDGLLTAEAMVEEILITTAIGVVFGAYVASGGSLVVALLANWLLNWFVFLPDPTFHPPVWQWSLGYLVLAGVWTVYKVVWCRKG